jgi:Zn-dependent membrane protease YugP
MLIIIFIVTMGISLLAAARVKSTYHKYAKVPAGSGLTGATAAARILDAAGIHDVEIIEQEGLLGDHYDPRHKRLVLCSENFHGQSAAALGVSAHECGHAIQHKIAYAPLTWRMAAVGVTTYANQLVMWLPLIGLFFDVLGNHIGIYLGLMAGGWGIIMAFNLITLPVEFDASRRAVLILNKMRLVTTEQADTGVRKVLNAAAWTYVAALITSLAYMLYYLLPLLLGRRN